jgi:nucleoside-diphosphate-sugar epimerase
VVSVPNAVAHAVARVDRLRARLTGAKPLLTPDRVRELSQADWTCDDSRARRELGYESRVALAEGLRETARWYREQGWV